MPDIYESIMNSGWMIGGPGHFVMSPNAAPTPSQDRVPATSEMTSRQMSNGFYSRGVSSGRYEAGYAPFGKAAYHDGCTEYMPFQMNGGSYYYTNGTVCMPARGLYSTYRIMDRHPTLNLARKMISGRILASSWTVRGTDTDVPKEWINLIEQVVTPLRHSFLHFGLRYMSFGWRPFEMIWSMKEGKHWLSRLKPLLYDYTSIITDKHGNFVGLEQHDVEKTKLWVSQYKAMIVTHDGDSDDHYGDSRHESAYDPWVAWQQARLDQSKLSRKIAGIIPTVIFPPGSTMVDGVRMDNSAVAQMILDGLADANGIAVQAFDWSKNDIMRNPDVLKATQWTIDFYDAGNQSQSQTGMIEQCEYNDKLMMRAWETPERAAMESTQSGSRADSDIHTGSAMSNSESVDYDLAKQFTKQAVEMLLLLNYGEKALGKVEVTPSPLVDRKRAAAFQFLKLLVVDPVIRVAIMKAADMNQLIDLVEIPRMEDFEIDENELLAPTQEDQTASGSGNPTGSSVSSNNRGITVGRTRGAIAASRKVRISDVKDELIELLQGLKETDDEN